MADKERYFIGPGLRDKLRDTVTRMDGMAYGHGIDEIPTRLQTLPSPSGGKVLRVCTFTGVWNKGDAKTVTLKFEGGTNTLAATNLLLNLDSSSANTTRTCIVGKEGTAWYFVSAENRPPCDSMGGKEISAVGYSSATNTTKLGNGDSSGPGALFLSDGCVRWVQATQISYISRIEYGEGTFTVSRSDAWVFAPVSVGNTQETLTLTPTMETVKQTVITSISLSEENLTAERAEILVLGVTPITSTQIEVYECSTATGGTSGGGE
jgi:hypothetical protein